MGKLLGILQQEQQPISASPPKEKPNQKNFRCRINKDCVIQKYCENTLNKPNHAESLKIFERTLKQNKNKIWRQNLEEQSILQQKQ